MSAWHLNLDVIDRILMNFDRTTGIFGCILWTKLMAVLLLAYPVWVLSESRVRRLHGSVYGGTHCRGGSVFHELVAA